MKKGLFVVFFLIGFFALTAQPQNDVNAYIGKALEPMHKSGIGNCIERKIFPIKEGAKFVRFQNGNVYWHPKHGFKAVYGPIMGKWGEIKWETGDFGFATTDCAPTPTKTGAFCHFERGSIYWSPNTGAHLIYGDIKNKWASMGWENSPLGFPTTDELASDKSEWAKMTKFENGTIYWKQGNITEVIMNGTRFNTIPTAATKIKQNYQFTQRLYDNQVQTTIFRRKDAGATYGNPKINETKTRSGQESNSGDKICRTEYHTVSAENMNQDVLDVNAINNLRLGGVYSVEELGKGNFTPIEMNRAPFYLTKDQQVEEELIQQPNNLNLEKGLKALLSKPFSSTPSINQYLESKTTNSELSLKINAGVSYSGYGIDAKTTFNYNKGSVRNKYLVNYTHAIFQVKAAPVGKFFNDDAQNQNNNLVYIDKITYGVRLLVFFESDMDSTEVRASFNGGGFGVKADASLETKKKSQNTEFKILLYGDKTPLQLTAIGFDNLDKEVNRLLNAVAVGNKTNPHELGKPISYSLRFLNGDIAATSLKAENIPTQFCRPNEDVPMNLQVSAQATHGGYGVYGWMDAELLNADGMSIGVQTILEVSDRAKIGSGESATAFKTINFNNISKADRDGGKLRIWGWINSDGGHFMHGLSLRQMSYTTGPKGHGSNQYFMDIPLRDFMSCMDINNKDSNGNIKSECKKLMHFRETEHSTATDFKVFIAPKFQSN